jgi:ketosteroid isomerase-like protein
MSATTMPAVVDAWTDAERSGDPAALAAVLADDFVGVGPLGFVLDKTAWIDRHASGALVNERFGLTDASVRTRGPVAVIVAEQVQTTTYRGEPRDGRFRITLVTAEERIVSLQLSPIQPPRSL